ncbi:MAG: FAD/NAD(P)-binding protein, partial [Candidatus Sericytochromatia bacterium]
MIVQPELASGPPGAMVPELAQVLACQQETSQIMSLYLRTGRPWAFAHGQFNMLWLPGIGEIPISLSGSAQAGDLLVHTVRPVGAVSRALCALQPGDRLGLRGPFGTGWPLQLAIGQNLLIIAGGLGLAPLRSLIHAVLHQRQDFGRVRLIYGSRSRQEIVFAQELEHWNEPEHQARTGLELALTLDIGDARWDGAVGVVPTLLRRLKPVTPQTIALICGPEIMMRLSAEELLAQGLAPEKIFVSL